MAINEQDNYTCICSSTLDCSLYRLQITLYRRHDVTVIVLIVPEQTRKNYDQQKIIKYVKLKYEMHAQESPT